MTHRKKQMFAVSIALLVALVVASTFATVVEPPEIPDIPEETTFVDDEPVIDEGGYTDEGDGDDLLVELPQEEIKAEITGGDFSDEDTFNLFWTMDEFVIGTSYATLYTLDGNPCLSIQNNDKNDARMEQQIDVLPNTLYRVHARVMAEGIQSDGDFGANIGIRDIFGGSKSLFDTQGAWQELSLYVQTGPDQQFMTVSLCLGGYGSLATGKAWFDDVGIEPVDQVPEGVEVLYADVASQEPVIPEEENTAANATDERNLILIGLFGILAAFGLYRLFERSAFSIAPDDERQTKAIVIVLLGLAFIVRATLALITKGHPTDISCFTAWSQLVVEHGIRDFYTSGFFSDYPPGYMYVLYIIGGLKQILSIQNDAVYSALVRLPAILADLVAAYALYRYARKHWNTSVAAALLALVAFNPTVILNSSVWAQIDSILALLLIVVFLLIKDKKFIGAAAVFGAAVLLKPQALMVGPVFALPYLFAFFDEDTKKKAPLNLVLGILAAVGVIVLGALPFTGSQQPNWLLDKYFGTMKQYDYASVHAFNLFSLLGGNWVKQDMPLGPLTYAQWGMIGIVLSLAATVYFAIKARKNGTLSYPLLTSFLLLSLFTLSHNMHERYAFPALFLLALAYLELRDIRIIKSLCILIATTFLNIASVLLVSQTPAEVGQPFLILTRVGSALSVLAFVYFAYVCVELLVFGRIETQSERLKEPVAKPDPIERLLCTEPVKAQRLTKIDRYLMLGLTLVYGVVAFINLGTTNVPQKYWKNDDPTQVVTVDFGQTREVSSIWSYGGISDAAISVSAVDEAGTITKVADVNVNFDVMFRWETVDAPFSASQVLIEVTRGKPWINELAFLDAQGKPIPIQSVNTSGGNVAGSDADVTRMFDEQGTIPDRPSVRNGMYFDELYHARTALEHLKGLEPYENSHPPLGKVLIMFGIAIFGMNPFGWRCVGTLFGVIMVPLMYLFGKRLTKRTDFALFTAFLMTFDFMHFVQTRIATVDVYGVFFIILMYYFMYRYYEMNFFVDGLKKTLVPLGLSGIFFGLGAASKWIGIYAGGGLAVLLFASLYKRFAEYRAARMAAENGEPNAERAVELTADFWKHVVNTGLFCVAFFIVIPLGIYLLSYLPYMLCKAKPYNLQGIWGVQQFMFNYHSQLTATHPFESKWYTWPVIGKPIWYYMGGHLPEGTVEGIFALGNPAVWWSALIAVISLITLRIRRQDADSRTSFLLIGLAAQFLPWTLITRATFIYHYFASVPFIILALTLWMERLEKRHSGIGWVKYALMGVALALFVLFYPSLAGTPIPLAYAEKLKWFGTWVFFVQ